MAFDAQNQKSAADAWLDKWAADLSADKLAHASAEVYAGVNPMAHHEAGNPRGGMLGGADIIIGMHSPERVKFLAGRELVSSRLHRRLGYLAGAKSHLRRATALRQQAAEMTGEVAS